MLLKRFYSYRFFLPDSFPARTFMSEEFLKKNEEQVLVKIARDTLGLSETSDFCRNSPHILQRQTCKRSAAYCTLRKKRIKSCAACMVISRVWSRCGRQCGDCRVESAYSRSAVPAMHRVKIRPVTIEFLFWPSSKIDSYKANWNRKHGLIISKGLRRGCSAPGSGGVGMESEMISWRQSARSRSSWRCLKKRLIFITLRPGIREPNDRTIP